MFGYIDSTILPLAFYMLIASTVGVCGNTIMLLVCYKSKKMRSPCHLLIAITCLADLLHETGQFHFLVHVFGNMVATQRACYYMEMIPLVGVCSGGPLILCLGIDRLIAVMWPAKYRVLQETPTMYLLAHLMFPLFYTFIILLMGYFNAYDELMVCAVPNSLLGKPFEIFSQTQMIFYALCVVLYGITSYQLRRHASSPQMRSVFKSILVTVAVVILGWTSTTIINTINMAVNTDPETIKFIGMYAGIPVNLATMSNIFVFYAINSEYRIVIKSLLGFQVDKKLLEASTNNAATRSNIVVVGGRANSLPADLPGRKRSTVNVI